MDIIYQGMTWQRTVTITDGVTGLPVDPTELVAVVCPDVPITVTQTAPGEYLAELADTATVLLEPGRTRWELAGRIGAEALLLWREDVDVQAVCAQLTPVA